MKAVLAAVLSLSVACALQSPHRSVARPNAALCNGPRVRAPCVLSAELGAGAEELSLALAAAMEAEASERGEAVVALPDGPSLRLVAFLWANTLILLPVSLLGALLKVDVLGQRFRCDAEAVVCGVAAAALWLGLSSLPLERWFPKRLGFMRDVTEHTELITAAALGATRGTAARSVQVAAAATLLSTTAGVLEEAAFRGTAQRGLGLVIAAALHLVFGAARGLDAAAATIAVVVASSIFGSLHNYCPGYGLIAGVAGAYFGAVYALTDNLFVAALAHALVDIIAFGISYRKLAFDSTVAYKTALARRDFFTTNALRSLRRRFDGQ